MVCRRYCAASRHEVLLDEDDFRSFLQTSSWTRRCSASSTSARDSSGTLKSISCSSSWSTNTGLPVPVWSSSSCLGVNTQRFVDSCPHTGLSVLVGVCDFIMFLLIKSVAIKRGTFLDFLFLSTHGSLPYLIIGFWVLVRFVGCLCSFQQYQNPNRTFNYLKKFFRFHHNRFRDTKSWECIIEDDGVRSCSIKLQSFPLSKLYIDPSTPYLGALSTFACTMQDVVWSNQALADLCDSYPKKSRL